MSLQISLVFGLHSPYTVEQVRDTLLLNTKFRCWLHHSGQILASLVFPSGGQLPSARGAGGGVGGAGAPPAVSANAPLVDATAPGGGQDPL